MTQETLASGAEQDGIQPILMSKWTAIMRPRNIRAPCIPLIHTFPKNLQMLWVGHVRRCLIEHGLSIWKRFSKHV